MRDFGWGDGLGDASFEARCARAHQDDVHGYQG
jgi:hypothetical protein